MNKCGLIASRSDSGVISSSVSESALTSASESGSKKAGGDGRQDSRPRLQQQPPLRKIRKRTPSEEIKRKEREARSIAIEKAYVHDVYEQISQHISDNRYRAWPRVKQFLQDLEPGSILCDVGCGSGKYLGINHAIFNIGSDRCHALSQMAREKEHEVMLCDNLALPFRDESIDAVLSIAVIHHIATAERRVHALRELARVLKVGGRVMISVWAMEQRQRKFESQDVLIPWHKPPSRVGSVAAAAAAADHQSHHIHSTTTATTDDDDVTHYHAYTQTSDSDQRNVAVTRAKLSSGLRRKNGRGAHRKAGRSFDPSACDILDGDPGFRPPYQSSSELSSPSNETCYSFVRRALQKFSASQRQLGISHSEILSDDGRASLKFQWFRLAGLEKLASLQQSDEDLDKLDSASALQVQTEVTRESSSQIVRNDSEESNQSSVGDLPIELPHLEDEDEMFNLHVFKNDKKSTSLASLRSRPNRGRSRSLDEMEMMHTSFEQPRKLRLSLRETRRAFTVENQDEDITSNDKKGPEGDMEMEDEIEDLEPLLRQKKVLKDFKSTLSSSLKSIDMSIRSAGSITSLSSGKSFVSNFSVKSDSGISLPAPKQNYVQGLPNLQEQPEMDLKTKLGRRSWDSEPVLNNGKNNAGSRRSKKESSSGSLSASKASLCTLGGEKEKSRAMQSVESKLMKAIKEVNESDISENSTPLNSPGPAAFLATSAQQPSKPLKRRSNNFPFQEKRKTFEDATTKEATTLLVETPPATLVQVENAEKMEEKNGKAAFDDLKAKIRAMPKFRPFTSNTNMGGSMDRGDNNSKESKGWGKQLSLHDELLSHERLTANEEMRKKIHKQQSLPEKDAPKRNRNLKEGLIELVSKSKQFESLKQSLVILRSNASTVVEEREENLTPREKESSQLLKPDEAGSLQDHQEKEAGAQDVRQDQQAPQITGQTIKSGIVRIWQSWRSTDRTEGPSFTHKRGVSIQPIEVRGRAEAFKEGGAAGRRSLFQRRRGGSSPLSPQQLEALAREDSMSPTSFRRCCMDCPGGDIVIVDQIRERKHSRGGETSDSSSKDGSIQSDTSLDSEDSCVSVIFVPHPDGRFGLTGEPVPELIAAGAAAGGRVFPRKQSNSSESSESTQSGKTSPIQSPGIRMQASPTKSSKTLTKIELFRQSVVSSSAGYEIVSRNLAEELAAEAVYCLADSRPLEKIDERHTESESEAEKECMNNNMEASRVAASEDEKVIDEGMQTREDIGIIPSVLEPINEEGSTTTTKNEEKAIKAAAPTSEDEKISKVEASATESASAAPEVKLLQKRLSSQKSFEMEDILHESSKKAASEAAATASAAPKRRLKSSKQRQRASRPLPAKVKYDYPIVRHHPLFAKQRRPGEGQSNFSSLLMGNNVRIIRGQSLSSNDSLDDRFDIFNPEVDDSDSDNDNGSISSEDMSTSSDATSTGSSTGSNSNDSVESVVSVSKASESLKEDKPPRGGESEEDLEMAKRAEKRRQSLMSLLDENQSVIYNITEKRRQMSLSGSSSASSLKQKQPQLDEAAIIAQQRASGAIPKKPLPAIVEPRPQQKKKLGKAKSVCSNDQSTASKSGIAVVRRQSSVPATMEKMSLASMTKTSSSSTSSGGSSSKTSPLLPTSKVPSPSSATASERRHLSPSSASDTSGIQVKGSHESLTESTDTGSERKSCKTPSPSKKMTIMPNSSSSNSQKKMLKKTASVEGDSKQGSLEMTEDNLVPNSSTTIGLNPVQRRMNTRKNDSIESNAPSTKHSDTSSLLSHRFSTVSISSNVSSSDVSISASGGHSGSSCYLASMSSTDFDDRPVLASSFSLSEAEIEPNEGAVMPPFNNPQQPRVKLKAAFKRSPLTQDGKKQASQTSSDANTLTAPGTEEETPTLNFARSRIGTATSIETSIENPALGHTESLDEELIHAFGKDDQAVDDEVLYEAHKNSNNGSSGNHSGDGGSSSNHRTSLSAASSNDSLHSDDGGSQTYHRYYHVFKEGELDYLINTYVDNLHIISSYYDHANWCIVAEKVNVWTI